MMNTMKSTHDSPVAITTVAAQPAMDHSIKFSHFFVIAFDRHRERERAKRGIKNKKTEITIKEKRKEHCSDLRLNGSIASEKSGKN